MSFPNRKDCNIALCKVASADFYTSRRPREVVTHFVSTDARLVETPSSPLAPHLCFQPPTHLFWQNTFLELIRLPLLTYKRTPERLDGNSLSLSVSAVTIERPLTDHCAIKTTQQQRTPIIGCSRFDPLNTLPTGPLSDIDAQYLVGAIKVLGGSL